ncbi:hypothetical protein ACLBOM_08125 [Escherichia coli]
MPVTTGEWRALSATDAECLRAPRSFRQAAEADFQSLHILALTLLLASVVLGKGSRRHVAPENRIRTGITTLALLGPWCGCTLA